MVIQKNIRHTYYHQRSKKIVTMREFNIHEDLLKLYHWLHYSHTIPNWNLNKPIKLLYQHFRKALENRYQSLFIMAINGDEIGYAETYHAPNDRLANFCKVYPGDFGIHLLIGPPDALAKGNCEPILCALSDYLFSFQLASRILVEPNHNVKQLSILERKLGYLNMGFIKLPEKIAILYAGKSEDFYRYYPKQYFAGSYYE